MTGQFSAPKGTFDLVPPESAAFLRVRDVLGAGPAGAGYGYVETPAFEDTALFHRGVGESTDVVTKETYTFEDRGGRSITLRPEGTAAVVRAVLEHGLDRGPLPVKLWYSGSFFRYERPQAGRYRHFSQVGAEALGSADPALDVELIWLAVEGYRRLGLTGVTLLLNSLGDQECRPAYRERLQVFLRGLDLDAETRGRIDINPLRVLDDKRESVQKQLAGVPLIADSLCAACAAHDARVRLLLDDLGMSYVDAPRLVRGLDYYTRTTFEFQHPGLGAQSAVGGGGRYDGLSEMLGGPPLPSVGWSLGVDRTVLAMRAEGIPVDDVARCAVFIVPLGELAGRRAVPLVAQLRSAGVAADMSYGGRGLKGAMKSADRSGAAYAVIVGERDLRHESAEVKNLGSGAQETVALADLVTTIREKLT